MALTQKLRVGVMSTANIARKNILAIKLTDCAEVVAVASRNLDKAKKYAEENGVTTAYGSYQELLDDSNIDAVYIPLPTNMHKEWVTKAAQAGKHVLCEKPAAANTAELDEILKEFETRDLVWMDGVMFMHHARMQDLPKGLDTIGEARHITSAFTFKGDDDFHATDIRCKPDLEPLGCLGDLGWYNVRFTLMALGLRLPIKVAAQCHLTPADAPRQPLDVDVQMVFDQGERATFHCSFEHPFRQTVAIAGTKGHLELDDFVQARRPEAKLTIVTDADCVDKQQNVVETRQELITKDSIQEQRMWEKFTALVRAGKDADGDSTDASSRAYWRHVTRATQQVLDACMTSAFDQQGAFVALEA
eukprot:TRINITY_DN11430_c0_g1_i2.p1 TRINITY_DN11430_c0_g1~~TRINITY_DN11430_c0_g1_i2.p1  ORF type:complete len:361 (+),score=111.67 TRINITY_DN11430_c0_g1_i2:4-1086(+)